MRPIVLFSLTWRGIKRLAALVVQVALFLVIAYFVVGLVTAVIAGLAMLLVARAFLGAARAD
ncbi:hypothetical protein DMH04_30240 [Kibdelosporangium aridum]|uniref:Uncharacterized protein n=1 Tax=Kibdelosporangium aridum TaxID=2030 RepID=A0A428Z3A3_KIBAR|nr:hypothetical protein [Kibdelosporangium aridum]RSM80413.1 hypothetical protein DMH04_30240 [Kibdelosporangium aridum]